MKSLKEISRKKTDFFHNKKSLFDPNLETFSAQEAIFLTFIS